MSYLRWPMASMARSKSTLSGCLELTSASGFLTFLCGKGQIQAAADVEVTTAKTKIARVRRMKTSGRMAITILRAQSSPSKRCAPCSLRLYVGICGPSSADKIELELSCLYTNTNAANAVIGLKRYKSLLTHRSGNVRNAAAR